MNINPIASGVVDMGEFVDAEDALAKFNLRYGWLLVA